MVKPDLCVCECECVCVCVCVRACVCVCACVGALDVVLHLYSIIAIAS